MFYIKAGMLKVLFPMECKYCH